MRKWHVIISMFFLPMFIFYIFTGAMFLLGQRSRGVVWQKYYTTSWPCSAETCAEEEMLNLTVLFLKQEKIEKRPPAIYKNQAHSFFWGRSGTFSVLLEKTSNNKVLLKTYSPTIYSKAISLHANRGKGGAFQIYGLVFSAFWLFSYLGLFFKKNNLIKSVLIFSSGLITLVLCFQVFYFF